MFENEKHCIFKDTVLYMYFLGYQIGLKSGNFLDLGSLSSFTVHLDFTHSLVYRLKDN